MRFDGRLLAYLCGVTGRRLVGLEENCSANRNLSAATSSGRMPEWRKSGGDNGCVRGDVEPQQRALELLAGTERVHRAAGKAHQHRRPGIGIRTLGGDRQV